MIKWLQRKFFEVFPDDQFATMVAHTVVTLGVALGVTFVFTKILPLGPLVPLDSVLSLAVAATGAYVFYHLREMRQKRKHVARGKAWTAENAFARNCDLIGPATATLTLWLVWVLG